MAGGKAPFGDGDGASVGVGVALKVGLGVIAGLGVATSVGGGGWLVQPVRARRMEPRTATRIGRSIGQGLRRGK